MPTPLRLIAAFAITALLAGCSKLTMENYSRIKMGTSYSEAVGILGKPDSCSEVLLVRNCIWGDEQKNITVNFVGDKAVLFTSRNIR